MIPGFLQAATVALLITLLIGQIRVARGPTDSDRLLGVLLSSTTAVAVLLVQAAAQGAAAVLDTALVLAILAPVVTAAYVVLGAPPRNSKEEP